MVEGSQNGGRVTGDSTSTIDNFQVQPIGRFAYPPRSRFDARHEDDWTPWILRSPVRQFPFALNASSGLAGIAAAAAWLQAPRCGRLHVSHSLDETAFGRSFCLCWAVRFATPRDDAAPPTNGGRRGFASFARGPAWNRMCQIAPRLAYCKLLLS